MNAVLLRVLDGLGNGLVDQDIGRAARARKDLICTRAAARQRGCSFRNEGLSPQNAALVFQVRHSGDLACAVSSGGVRVCAVFRGVKNFWEIFGFCETKQTFLASN